MDADLQNFSQSRIATSAGTIAAESYILKEFGNARIGNVVRKLLLTNRLWWRRLSYDSCRANSF